MNRKKSEESKRKCSESMKKVWTDPKYRKQVSTAYRGFSDETRQKISNTLKGQPFTEQRRFNISNALRGRHHSDEWCKHISQAHIGQKRSKEACKRMSEVRTGIKLSEETKNKMSIAKKGYKPSDETMAKLCKSLTIKPNKSEQIILNLLDRLYPNEWKYTGDFSFIINGKCPDFVNCNGKKKVIEFNGTYWHQNDIPGEREKIFAGFGYDTLIIWDHELKDMAMVAEKIRLFEQKQSES